MYYSLTTMEKRFCRVETEKTNGGFDFAVMVGYLGDKVRTVDYFHAFGVALPPAKMIASGLLSALGGAGAGLLFWISETRI